MWRLILSSFVVFFVAGCDGHTSVTGTVHDVAGNAVVGANVRLVERRDAAALTAKSEATTDDRGRFSLGATHAPTNKISFTLTVSKDAYKSHSEVVTPENRNRPRAIVLNREPDQ